MSMTAVTELRKRTFARQLRAYLELNGIENKILARKLKVCPATIQNWLRCYSYPTRMYLEKIEEVTGLKAKR